MSARRAALAAVLGALLAGCASTGSPARTPNPRDPLEGWNRGVFAFNDKLDAAVLKPVAEGYRKVVPEPARQMVGNFFGNFGDAWSAVNQLLQGKPVDALNMGMRFGVNTVLGAGGLLDPASEAGLERKEEDFGQTLGRWGMPSGAYIVWPVLGPSAVRESVALPLDRGWSPNLLMNDTGGQIALTSLNLVDTRTNLLGATGMLDQIALDRYSFVRDAWLARRRSLVYDGDPPETPADTEPPEPGEPASAPKR